MKLLKCWGWVLTAIAVLLYGIGVFSGEFDRNNIVLLFYGTSEEAMFLSACSVMCLLLAITVFFIVYTMEKLLEAKKSVQHTEK